jgi:hypothetical protein
MTDKRPTRRLNIDLAELAYIFDLNEPELSYYFDLETGQILLVTDETRSQLEAIYDEYCDEEDQIDLEAALDELGLSDSERQELLIAHQVEMGYGERIIRVPAPEPRQGYLDMIAFIETVEDPRLKTRLEQAINKRGAFRNFKDALTAYPGERERWFAFKDASLQKRVLAWLADEDIEPL